MVLPFVFQFSLICNFGKLINFGLGTVRIERVQTDFYGRFHFGTVLRFKIRSSENLRLF